jgi:hypothetical protein
VGGVFNEDINASNKRAVLEKLAGELKFTLLM